ncbi:MAG: AAA family ATPase [Deltaproteobacteria bacterium]|nr:AAA family ATPase [Deltaproteobacteria bacterium]MBI2182142.1 AAA family ATPase [Deltaproteobacteria bacterium]MBI2230590.1 AAA family ATPase [Deltaproteobacteria bacterium]MBI2364992.1 AAA family ATPase [Deltaproteobacteria bacterium]MBI2532604.1 AAA family ATPase [Deltaproteobacteria bacterium]
MLKKLIVKGFKSLEDVAVEFPRMAVLFGPNAAGKSNLLDAIQALSRIGTSRTLSDALSEPIRGYPIEAFAFPAGGLAALLSQTRASFSLETVLDVGIEHFLYNYRFSVEIQPGSGSVSVQDEYLVTLGKRGEPKGNPSIERVEDQLRIRRKSKPANPRRENVGQNYAILSDPRWSGVEYRAIERCRNELSGWRTYYLDPRVAMRSARPPSDVRDIGVLGEDIAPFLYRLRAEQPKRFDAVKRTLRSLIPSVEDLTVDLDKKRGTLDILVRQGGKEFSSRIVSEGTLRVLALCALTVNPWSGSLLAFEEPENGVHPRRLELIVQLLSSLAVDSGRQIVVTTHSPLFCDAVLKLAKQQPKEIALLRVRQGGQGTEIVPFSVSAPLFKDLEIAEALTTGTEDGLFESLILRGMIDE